MDDILQDAINLFGDVPSDDGKIHYGPLVLTTAPKVCLDILALDAFQTGIISDFFCVTGREGSVPVDPAGTHSR